MATQVEYAPGEVVERGEKLYEQSIRQQVEAGNVGKYLVINVETGQWELNEDHSEAILRARAKYPSAGLFGMKIGYPAAVAFGTRLRPLSSVTPDDPSEASEPKGGQE